MSMSNSIEPLFLSRLVCPRDRTPLTCNGTDLACASGHSYPVVEGVPVLLVDGVRQTHGSAEESLQHSTEGRSAPDHQADEGGDIDPFVNQWVGATCGVLYRPLIGRLNDYPIPELPMPASGGETLLDIGCNWGRWTLAAAKRGYRAIGIDPHLDAILAARRVARMLELPVEYVVGDARFLPFAGESFDRVFSYSVIQHFSRQDARLAFREAGRVLRPGGLSRIQMANQFGLRSLYHQARRRFRDASGFEVRYWRPGELTGALTADIGPSELDVDGFFGLGMQRSDIHLLPARYRPIVIASELLAGASAHARWLTNLADSVYVTSGKLT